MKYQLHVAYNAKSDMFKQYTLQQGTELVRDREESKGISKRWRSINEVECTTPIGSRLQSKKYISEWS